jgi:Zn-dependent protease
MLPLPPLDGGRVAVGLLPRNLALPLARTERFGFVIIIGLLFVLPLVGDQIGVPLDFLGSLIGGAGSGVVDGVLWITGNGDVV